MEDYGSGLLTQSKILVGFPYTAYSILISSRDLVSFAFERAQFSRFLSFSPFGSIFRAGAFPLNLLTDKVLFIFSLKVSLNEASEEMGI